MSSCQLPGKLCASIILLIVLGGRPTPGQSSPNLGLEPPAAPAGLDRGSVTVPYQEWLTLWNAARPTPAPEPARTPPPPVAFSIQSARYELELGPDARRATGKAVFEVADFATGWTCVPLIPSQQVRILGVEPAGTLVTLKDGIYTLLLDAPGHHAVTLSFSADLAAGDSSTTRSLRLNGPSALVNELQVSGVPTGWVASVDNASPAAANPAVPSASGTESRPSGRSLYQLPADIPIVLTVASEAARRSVPTPVPSQWHGQVQSLVRYDEGQLTYKTRLRLSADSGTGTTAVLALPATANILAITGIDLDRWHSVRSPKGDARQIELSWKTADTLRRELSLEYELPQPSRDGDWHLSSPQIISDGSRLDAAMYAVETIQGVEFVEGTPDETPIAPGQAQQLPHWMAEALTARSFICLSVDIAAPADVSTARMIARPLPLIQTARATVEEAHFHTRLVADGALLCEAVMSIRHEGSTTLGLVLPSDAQLLSCSVDGHDTLPIDRGHGRVELDLAAEESGKATQVAYTYTGRLPALAPVSGRIALALPETDLFTQTMRWDLQIPQEYELTALEGNVSLNPGSSDASDQPPLIHLRKDLLKGERPTAELFYQKRAVAP